MAKLIDYVKSVGQKTADEIPFSEVDIALLNELGYLPMDHLLPESLDSTLAVSLPDLSKRLLVPHTVYPKLNFQETKIRCRLLKEMAESPRYQEFTLRGFANQICSEKIEQFSAVFWECGDWKQVSFRGTDDSLVGWKEDLMLAYMNEIPSQLSAKKYLEKVLTEVEGNFVVSGHSKGGNLAIYACSQMTEAEQDRIQAVYLFDAPGLYKELTQTPGYIRIAPKCLAIRPQDSIIGVLMESSLPSKIVKSSGSGLMQHNIFLWKQEKGEFVTVKEASSNSQLLEQTFKILLEKLSVQELQLFADSFFDLFFSTGAENVGELIEDLPQKFQLFISSVKELSTEEKNAIQHAIKVFYTVRIELEKERFLKKWASNKSALDFEWPSWESLMGRIRSEINSTANDLFELIDGKNEENIKK